MRTLVGGLAVAMLSSLPAVHAQPYTPLPDQTVAVDAAKWPVSTADQHFHLYLSPATPVVKGVFMFLFHGSGQYFSELPEMRALADELGCAVMGFDKSYDYPHKGVPTTILLSALDELATASGHPEIAQAPLCTFGHSNGTYFSCGFAAEVPERIIAWIAWKSANGGQFSLPPLYRIPGLVVSGEQDHAYFRNQLETVKRLRYREHALMHMVIEPGSGHGQSGPKSFTIVMAFMKAAFLLRVPPEADPRQGPVALKPLAEAQGWLGQNVDGVRLTSASTHTAAWQQPVDLSVPLEIAPFADYPGDRGYASWLPTEDYARKWQTFCMKGDLADWSTLQPPVAVSPADRLAQAQRLEASDPLAAEAAYRRLTVAQPGTPEAQQAAARLAEAGFQATCRAWGYLRTMRDAEMALEYTIPFMHVDIPLNDEFYTDNGERLATMQTAAAALEAEFPDSPATVKARLMLERYKLIGTVAGQEG